MYAESRDVRVDQAWFHEGDKVCGGALLYALRDLQSLLLSHFFLG